jgi:hypothetical protein
MSMLATLPLVVATAAVGLGVFAPTPAPASCVGPTLMPPAVSLHPGSEMPVTGEWFYEGCNDTSVSTGSTGCSHRSEPPPEQPARDVPLTLTQGTRTWTLATADAAGLKRHFRVQWQVRMPDDLQPGSATLSARTATVPLVINAP